MEAKFFQEPARFVKNVKLYVNDLKNTLHFYESILGLQVMERLERRAILTADGDHPLLEIEQPVNVEAKKRGSTGLFHFALLLPDKKDFACLIHHLSEEKISLGGSDHLVSEAIYFNDPEGNGIEVYIDRPAREWKWMNREVKMVTDPLDTEGLLQLVDSEWNGFPPETRMGHIHLHVQDLQETLRFYTEGLGFDITNHMYPKAVFLSTEKYHHHIALNTWKGEGAPSPSRYSAGLKYFTLVFPSEGEREEAVVRLKGMGYSTDGQEGSIVVMDPSSNVVQLLISS